MEVYQDGVPVYQDGVPVYCLPEGARCELDPEGRSPLDLEECPLGEEDCSGDCLHFAE